MLQLRPLKGINAICCLTDEHPSREAKQFISFQYNITCVNRLLNYLCPVASKTCRHS